MLMCTRQLPCEFLFVEDDPGIQHMVRTMAAQLLDDGMRFTVAASLSEAHAILASPDHPHFESILLDPGLPDSSGIATYEAIRRAVGDDVDIVVYTGQTDREFADLMLYSGAERVLFKGVWTFAQVATLLHYAAGRSRVIRRERERCRQAEASAAALQALVDSINTGELTPEAFQKVTSRIDKVRLEVKSLAAA